MIQRSSLSMLAAVAAGVGVLTSCSLAVPSPATSSSPRMNETSPASAPAAQGRPIALRCDEGTTNLIVPRQPAVMGLIFDFLAVHFTKADVLAAPTVSAATSRYVALKSVLYVTPRAARRTKVTLIFPSSARLYYTDWGTWQQRPSDRQILQMATTTVTVRQCGNKTAGYPGMLLVRGPTCVTVRVSGSKGSNSVTRTVAVGRKSCLVPLGNAPAAGTRTPAEVADGADDDHRRGQGRCCTSGPVANVLAAV